MSLLFNAVTIFEKILSHFTIESIKMTTPKYDATWELKNYKMSDRITVSKNYFAFK